MTCSPSCTCRLATTDAHVAVGTHDSVLIDAVAEMMLRRHIDHSLVDFEFLKGVQNRETCALATD